MNVLVTGGAGYIGSHRQIALLFCAGGAMEKRTYERRGDRSGRR